MKSSKASVIEVCPQCDDDRHSLGIRWTNGRKLVQYCHECEWEGPPYTPPKKPIESTLHYSRPGIGGWVYHLFDGRGYVLTYSRGYSTRKECVKEAKRDLANYNTLPGPGSRTQYGKCTAVVFPPSVKVKGTILR